MSLFGSVGEWRSEEEDWKNYKERLQMYFLANDVVDAGKQRAILLSVVGAKTYAILRGLSGNNPSQKTFTELCELMELHIRPAPNEIHERFLFYSRDRKDHESIGQYIAELRKLSENCSYGDKLNEQLRDRLVVGVRNEKIQQRLRSERALTLEKALETALSIESSTKFAKEIQCAQGTRENYSAIHKLPDKRECYKCGSGYHLADKCPFIDKECFGCKRRGHTRRKCRQAGSRQDGGKDSL